MKKSSYEKLVSKLEKKINEDKYRDYFNIFNNKVNLKVEYSLNLVKRKSSTTNGGIL